MMYKKKMNNDVCVVDFIFLMMCMEVAKLRNKCILGKMWGESDK